MMAIKITTAGYEKKDYYKYGHIKWSKWFYFLVQRSSLLTVSVADMKWSHGFILVTEVG